MPETEFLSRRDIANRLGVPDYRVRYVLTSREIKPAFIVSGRAIFSASVVHEIQLALQETAERGRPSLVGAKL